MKSSSVDRRSDAARDGKYLCGTLPRLQHRVASGRSTNSMKSRASSREDAAPPLPSEIRKAHDLGNLVLFCGAGVSADAGYPLFEGLVKDIYDSIPGHVPDARETRARNAGEFDRALHLLEARLRNNEVRRATLERLSRKPRTLAVHEALLRIAKQRDGVHLVTTNFDNLFAKALKTLGYKSTEVDSAPKLPVPKSKKWNSVVHLHGRIDALSDPDGRRLVLTTADFGASYLTEGWASRFVSELIRRYTILFVGYQADDVVMRYILDALDADLRLSEQVYRPFAFASIEPGASSADQLAAWQAKGIQPIPYPTIGASHHVLRACLTRWGRDWSDGREGKASIVQSLAPSQPDLPPPEKERLLWALADSSGLPARQLITKNDAGQRVPRAPIGWLDVFSEAGLLAAHSNEHEAGVSDSFIGGTATQYGVGISDRGWEFILWLRAHMPNVAFYRKVAAAGGALHPAVALDVRRTAVEEKLEAGRADLSAAWSIITSPAITLPRAREMTFAALNATCKAIERWPESSWIDHDIEYALTPYLRVDDPQTNWNYEAAYGLAEADRTTKQYLSAEVVLRCGNGADMIATALKGQSQLLARLARRADTLLQRALDLHLVVSDLDPSSFVLPRIRGLSDNYRRRGWALLIDLTWSAFLSCETHDPAEAAALYESWTRSPHSTHRRLMVRAAEDSTLLTPSQRLGALLGAP